ncbi:LAMI_0B04984g1_1 [Lachancea mirantina]|uniref:Tethering factor for nuclear proteasome STS1 n=1 Tax=Lachancea mirantina TaxID=1230905 RepID=A0A1G4IVX4_9SACH|nr:LAMI_0B04984g1_1 [Lachancea mirantina]
MSQAVGFSWGFKPSTNGSSGMASNGCKVMKPRVKRRLTNEESQVTLGVNTSVNNVTINKFKAAGRRRTARSGIQGQALPLARALELMDRASLQATLLDLLKLHPETQKTFMALQPASRSVEHYCELLQVKLQAIYDNLPYTRRHDDVDTGLNDYAFVRVKDHVQEFLNCLVDCLLESIPPQTQNLLQSLRVLDAATDFLQRVPQFSTTTNNYYKDMCYEQLAEVWATVVTHVSEDLVFSASLENVSHWLQRLQEHNNNCSGKLNKPVSLFSSFVSRFTHVKHSQNPVQDQQPSSIWNNLV